MNLTLNYGIEGKTIKLENIGSIDMTGYNIWNTGITYMSSGVVGITGNISGFDSWGIIVDDFVQPKLDEVLKNCPAPTGDANLVLLLSTNQEIKGYFDHTTYKYCAYGISDNCTPFSLENIDIHEFVTGWREDYGPQKGLRKKKKYKLIWEYREKFYSGVINGIWQTGNNYVTGSGNIINNYNTFTTGIPMTPSSIIYSPETPSGIINKKSKLKDFWNLIVK